MITGIVLDSDGVVFDSMPLYTKIFCDLLETYGVPRKESEFFYNYAAGISLDRQFFGMLQLHESRRSATAEMVDWTLEEIRKSYEGPTLQVKYLVERFFEIAAKNIPDLFDDVKPALEKLGAYKKIISTNTRQDILDRRVEHHDLKKYLDGYFGTNGFKRKEEHFDVIKKNSGLSDENFKNTAFAQILN